MDNDNTRSADTAATLPRENRQPGHPWNVDRPSKPAPKREAIETRYPTKAALDELELACSLADLRRTRGGSDGRP